MKFSASIFAIIFSLLPLRGSAESIDPIPLFTSSKYDPRKEEGREFAEFTSSFGLSTIGQFYLSNAVDIEKDVLKKLSSKDLRTYFEDLEERKMIAKSISAETHKRFLGGTLSNAKVTGAINYVATTLMNEIINRAMEKQGIKDQKRRNLWSQKILSPFHLCIKKTKTYNEANKCLEAVQKDAVKNIGLAVVYELARQETSAEIAALLPARFHKCVKPNTSGADSRVMTCALEGARQGITNHGVSLVEKAAKENKIKNPKAIVSQVKISFGECVKKAINKNDFLKCGNDLISKAGSLMAAENISAHPQIKTYVTDKKQLQNLAAQGKKQFQLCIAEQTSKNDALADTAACAHQVKMDTTKTVGLLQISQTVKAIKGMDPKQQEALVADLSGSLGKCWNSKDPEEKNGNCLRTNVITLATKISDSKLQEKFPEGLQKQSPKLKTNLVNSFEKCLSKELPKNFLEGSSSGKKLDLCTGQLQREAALEVASFTVKETLVGNISDDQQIKKLDSSLVKEKFSKCLGRIPSEQKVEECALQLKKDAGLEIGAILFATGYDSFVKKEGGMKELDLSAKDRQTFLASLLQKHKDCLAKGNAQSSDTFVNQCFKASVREMAQNLGKRKFAKSIKNLILPAQAKSISKLFLDQFDECLQEKDGDQYDIKDYLTHIDSCGLTLSSKFTLEIARLRIHNSVQEHLPEERESDTVKSLKADLLKDFSHCMETNGKSPAQNRVECAKKLENEGVIRIVREATRREVSSLFSQGHPELKNIESRLDLCVKEESVMENCAMSHILAAAKRFGSLKFHAQLESALGKADAQEKNADILAVEKDYFSCLDKVKRDKLSADFLHEIKQCATLLERRGIEIVQTQFTNWMNRSMASEQEPELLKKVALSLPCFDQAFTFSPAEAGDSVDAEGILKELAKLIGGYIDYDLEKANDDFDAIIEQLAKDLEAAGPPEARKKLLALLVDRGVADRLLRSIVAAQVKEKLNALPKEEQLPEEVKKILTDKTLLEKSIGPKEMANLKPILVEKILTPLLLEGKSMKAKEPSMAATVIEREVADILLNSPAFGDILVNKAIQSNIDAERGISDWVFENVFGYNYDWSQLKNATEARDYVRQNIIGPRIRGETISDAEMKKRKKKAKGLVIEAMKNQ